MELQKHATAKGGGVSFFTNLHYNLPMHIRPATLKDAQAFHEIHTKAVRTTCKDYYTDEQISAWLSGRTPEGYDGIAKGEMFTALEADRVIGFGHAIPGEVVAIYVDPDFHGKGVGSLLLDHALKIASSGHKKVKVISTLNAEGFYKKHGFTKVKEDVVVRNGVEIGGVEMERGV